jgi:hypothetical protein
MFTFLSARISVPAFAGGGVYMSLEKATTIASCNNGQVKFQEELWDYGSDGIFTKWALVVTKNGKKEVFRVMEENTLFNRNGSRVRLNLNYDFEDEQGYTVAKGARLETNITFDGSAGTISAWLSEGGSKGRTILNALPVKDCHLE